MQIKGGADEDFIKGILCVLFVPLAVVYIYMVATVLLLGPVIIFKYSPTLFFSLVILAAICELMGICIAKLLACIINVILLNGLIWYMSSSAGAFYYSMATIGFYTAVIVIAYSLEPHKKSLIELCMEKAGWVLKTITFSR